MSQFETASDKMKRNQKKPAKKVIPMPPASYQPSKADMEESFDMPKAKMSKLRKAFFTPVSFDNKDKG